MISIERKELHGRDKNIRWQNSQNTVYFVADVAACRRCAVAHRNNCACFKPHTMNQLPLQSKDINNTERTCVGLKSPVDLAIVLSTPQLCLFVLLTEIFERIGITMNSRFYSYQTESCITAFQVCSLSGTLDSDFLAPFFNIQLRKE